MSAHRAPARVASSRPPLRPWFEGNNRGRWDVCLPGVVAAWTRLPVISVPVAQAGGHGLTGRLIRC